jgi:hypothetical protein
MYLFFPDDGLSYDAMQARCENVGGELARIDTVEQNAVALRLAGSSRAYIGLNDRDYEDTWLWADGGAPSFTYWRDDEPNDRNGEDCVVLESYHSKAGRWNDVSCDDNVSSEGFLCSKGAFPSHTPPDSTREIFFCQAYSRPLPWISPSVIPTYLLSSV